MKALEILKEIRNIETEHDHRKEHRFDEAIKELKALDNRNCNGCKYLEEKEKNLKFECLIEVCRTCSRINIDKWESK